MYPFNQSRKSQTALKIKKSQTAKSSKPQSSQIGNTASQNLIQGQTYLKSLYLVKGNGFNIVRQPVVLSSDNLQVAVEEPKRDKSSLKASVERHSIKRVKKKSFGKRRYTADPTNHDDLPINLAFPGSTDETHELEFEDQAQGSPFEKTLKSAQIRGLSGQSPGTALQVREGNIITPKKTSQTLFKMGAEENLQSSQKSQFDFESNQNLSQTGPIGNASQIMNPVLSDLDPNKKENSANFVSVQNLMNMNQNEQQQRYSIQDSDTVVHEANIFQPISQQKQQKVYPNAKVIQKRSNQGTIESKVNNKDKGDVQVIISNSGTVTVPNQERLAKSQTNVSAKKSIRYKNEGKPSTKSFIKFNEVDTNEVSRGKLAISGNQQPNSFKISKSVNRKNQLKSLLSLREYQENQNNGSIEIHNIDLLANHKMGKTKKKGNTEAKLRQSNERMAYTDGSARSAVQGMDNMAEIEYMYDQLNDNMTHIDAFEIQNGFPQRQDFAQGTSEPGFAYGKQPGNSKTVKKIMSKKTFDTFFNKRKRPSAFSLTKGKNTMIRRESQDSSSHQAISRIFSATDMHSGERVPMNDDQSLSTQMRTQTNTNRNVMTKRKAPKDMQEALYQQNIVENTSSDANIVQDQYFQNNPYELNVSNKQLANIQPLNPNSLMNRENTYSTKVLSRHIPTKAQRAKIESKASQPQNEPPLQLHQNNVDMSEDLEKAKKFRKLYQAHAESEMLNKALKEEQHKRKLGKIMEASEAKGSQQLEGILEHGGDDIPFSRQTSNIKDRNDDPDQVYGVSSQVKGEVKKRLTIYQRRDLEFQRIYEQTIIKLRENQAKNSRSVSTDQNTSISPFVSMTNATQSNKITPTQSTIQGDDQDKKAKSGENTQNNAIAKEQRKQKKSEFNIQALNLYQQRGNLDKIMSNRIRILQNTQLERRFRHKDQNILINPNDYLEFGEADQHMIKQFRQDRAEVSQQLTGLQQAEVDANNVFLDPFDPIRSKIRVMPISRAPNMQGKSPDYYFIQASKQSFQNNLTLAIETLYRGLALNPQNMLCRFTHGVIMFKLGLLTQAKEDFEMILPLYPKEYFISYNLALTLLQIGDYKGALSVLGEQLKKSKESSLTATSNFDFELYYDSLMMKAQCQWRSNQPIEAVKSFNTALRVKQNHQFDKENDPNRHQKKYTEKELEQMLSDVILVQTKWDLINELEDNERHVRSLSPKIITESFEIQQNRDQLISIQKESGDGTNLITPSRSQTKFDSKEQTDKINISRVVSDEQKAHESKESQVTEKAVIVKNVQELTSSKDSASKKMQGEEEQQFDQIGSINIFNKAGLTTVSDLGTAQSQQFETKSARRGAAKNQSTDAKILFSDQRQHEIRKDQGMNQQMSMSSQKSMIESSIKLIGQTQQQMVRDSSLTSKEIKIIDQQTRMEPKKNLTDIFSGKGLSEPSVIEEYSDPKQLRESMNKSTSQSRTEKAHSKLSKRSGSMLSHSSYLSKNKEVNRAKNQIENRDIVGVSFAKNGIGQINHDQGDLERMIIDLDNKFVEVSTQVEREIEKQDKKIYNTKLKNEDVSDYLLRNQGKHGEEQNNISRQDKVIKKLKECIQRPTPDDVQNVLLADLKEKHEMRVLQDQKKSDKQQRLDQRKLKMIQIEFENVEGKKRSFKNLDLMLQHLKFFQRFNNDQRKMVFQEAQYLSVPARTTIFKQGDIGDKMYVIIKGRVAVEKTTKEQGNLPVVQAILTDGDHFGELGLIDQNKIAKHTQDSGMSIENYLKEHQRFHGRKASCITAEHTDLLILYPNVSNLLFQPDKKAKKGVLQMTDSKAPSQRDDQMEASQSHSHLNGQQCSSVSGDELSKKITMLQSLEVFSDLDPNDLMPIAANIFPKTYNYGEFLVEKGHIPEGLFVIQEGQCKVVAKRNGQRQLIDNRAGGPPGVAAKNTRRLELNDPVLQDYNPATTILNQVNSMSRGYQNARVLIGETDKDGFGQQIKDRMEYVDYMVFNQLTKGNSWGSRVLVPTESYLKRKYVGQGNLDRFYPPGVSQEFKNKESDEQYHMKSLLSIVADSAKVRVWIIRKQDMAYLPEKAFEQVYEKVISLKEEDRPYHEQDILYIIDQFQKWDRYKIDQVEQLLERKAMDKFFKGN